MMIKGCEEIIIYESPDGGKTVYARKSGSSNRELYSQDPELQQLSEELENSKRWIEIFQARKDNPELDRLCEQVEVFYELGKKQE